MDFLKHIEQKIVNQSFFEQNDKALHQKKIVFTNGCFDILHVGHITYLAQARQHGDLLVVGLNTDASVKRLKGPSRPVNQQNDRAKVLAALESVDYVVLFEEDTPQALIEKVRPDVLIKGGDYSLNNIVGADFVQKLGGKVLTIPFVEGYSTTATIQHIND